MTYGTNIGRSKPGKASAAPPVPNRKKAKPPPVPRRNHYLLALYDYTASDGDELSFSEGDKLTLVSKSDCPDGWMKCTLNGKEGMIPENYVKSV